MTAAARPTTRPSAAFLDRDGTLIRDTGYPSDPEEVELLPGAARGVRALNRRGIPVVVVTNQSGIGRGYFDEEAYRAVREAAERALAARGARIDRTLHCPHAPAAGCSCRKPALGLYREAARELGVDLERGLYVGDRTRDVEAAARTGGTGLLIRGPDADGPVPPPPGCRTAPDLASGVAALLGGASGGAVPDGSAGPDAGGARRRAPSAEEDG